MQTKAKLEATALEPLPTNGAITPAGRRATSSVVGRDAKPVPQTLTDMGQIYFSALRFLVRTEIGETFAWGSNGLSCQMPQTDASRLSLYRRLPQPDAGLRLEAMLADEIAKRATPSSIRQAVAAAIAAFPSGSKADPAYVSALIDLLIEEANISGWHHLAVVGGLIRIARTSTFLPSVPEVIESINVAREEIWSARVFAEKVPDVFQELEDRLIWAGLVTFQNIEENPL